MHQHINLGIVIPLTYTFQNCHLHSIKNFKLQEALLGEYYVGLCVLVQFCNKLSGHICCSREVNTWPGDRKRGKFHTVYCSCHQTIHLDVAEASVENLASFLLCSVNPTHESMVGSGVWTGKDSLRIKALGCTTGNEIPQKPSCLMIS